MENKKNPKADLRRKRSLYFSLGLLISLSAALAALEYRTIQARTVEKPDFHGNISPNPFEIDIQPTHVPKKPKPPVKSTKPIADQFTLVDDIGDEVLEITEIDIDVKQPLALDQPILWDVDTVLDEPDIPILHPGIMPEYPGGLKKLYSFIAKGIRYPDPARRAGIQGTVHVQFIVRKDGTITDLEILRGIGFGCDEEALRVLKQMEDWMPGMQMNRPISVIMRIPIIFTLK